MIIQKTPPQSNMVLDPNKPPSSYGYEYFEEGIDFIVNWTRNIFYYKWSGGVIYMEPATVRWKASINKCTNGRFDEMKNKLNVFKDEEIKKAKDKVKEYTEYLEILECDNGDKAHEYYYKKKE